MARMQEKDTPRGNWSQAYDYEEDYRNGSRLCDRYEQSLSTLEQKALAIYKKVTGLETVSQAVLESICANCNAIVSEYQSKERDFNESADFNGYVQRNSYDESKPDKVIDPKNPYLEESDILRRDAAYSRMREAVYSISSVQEEDGSIKFPIISIDIPEPISKSNAKEQN